MAYGDTLSLDAPPADQRQPARGAALLRRLDAASDRLSPIVVKEVRQIVRGREFNYSLLGSLVIGLLVAFFGAASASGGSGTTGQAVFSSLMACLVLLGVAIVPMGAFSALRNERLEQTMDLITVTSLSARQVIVGKLLAQAVKLATLFAGMAPFVATSFLLGGIDFVTIVVSLAVAFLASMWVCAAALFMSSLARTRGMSAVLFVGVGFLLLVFVGGLQILTGIMMAFTGAGGGGGGVAFGVPAGTFAAQGWWMLGILTTIAAMTLVNLVLLAENRLLSPVDNKSTALRVGFLVQFLGIVGAFTALARLGPPLPRPVEPMAVLCFLHLGVVAAFVVTEDFAVSRRVQRQMQTAWWRRLGVVLWPGGGYGAVYVLTQMVLLLLAVWPMATERSDVPWVLAACGYICFFTGVPTVALRLVSPSLSAFVVRVAIVLLLALSLVLPDILYFVFWRPDTFDLGFSGRHLLNPIRALSNWGRVEARNAAAVPLIIGAVGLLSYVAIAVMNRRARRHTP